MTHQKYNTSIPQEDLTFDRNNPRFAKHDLYSMPSDAELAVFIYQNYAAHNLVQSMSAAGYFPQQPMTVAKENGLNIVLDGNLRLAAVRIIMDQDLRNTAKAETLIFNQGARETLHRIPVFITRREDHWRHSLNTHMHGGANWDTYAKAAFIHQLHRGKNLTIKQIASQTGYHPHHVTALFETMELLIQAEQEISFNKQTGWAGRLYTPWLYLALAQPAIRDFIGLPHQPSTQTQPVHSSKTKELQELFTWLHGDSAGTTRPVITQAGEDIPKLDRVLTDPQALDQLRKTQDLQRTYHQLASPEPTFAQALDRAKAALHKAEDALNRMDQPPPPHLLGSAREIAAMADNLQGRRRHTR